jgi:hypothetical protein
MPHEVIMPALGMAQQTGKIIAWKKRAGDAIAVGDILMDVETDKTTMEVEAAHAGVLGALLAGEGEDVPVGQVVARIEGVGEAPAPKAAEAPAAAPPPAPAAVAAPPAIAAVPAAQPQESGRILASPLARRVAAERGIDLAALVAGGVGQPIHLRDLDRLPAAVQPAAAPQIAVEAPIVPAQPNLVPQPPTGRDRVVARATRSEFLDMRASLAKVLTGVEDATLWAAFAAAAWREAGATGVIAIGVHRPGGVSAVYTDPDRSRFSAIVPAGDASPGLMLRDLTESRFSRVQLAGETMPVLTIGLDENGDFALSLDMPAGALAADAAMALVEGFAQRLEMPLRHLL